MTNIPKIGLAGSGGGSGIEVLLEKVEAGEIAAEVAIVIGSKKDLGVKKKVDEFNKKYNKKIKYILIEDIPNKPKEGDYTDEQKQFIINAYQKVIKKYGLDYLFLSGWLKMVLGHDPSKVVNIHPGPIDHGYGGDKMYGNAVHEKIFEDFESGKINRTCMTMHYATEIYDDGPIIAQIPVTLDGDYMIGGKSFKGRCESAKEVGERVNAAEHYYQWYITDLVVRGEITWSGVKGEEVFFGEGCTSNKKVNFPEGFEWGKEIDLTK